MIVFDDDMFAYENSNRLPSTRDNTYKTDILKGIFSRNYSRITGCNFKASLDMLDAIARQSKFTTMWFILSTDNPYFQYAAYKVLKRHNCKVVITGFNAYNWMVTGKVSKPGAFKSTVHIGYTSSYLPTIFRLVSVAVTALQTLTTEELRNFHATGSIYEEVNGHEPIGG